jgi:hypothetical protein
VLPGDLILRALREVIGRRLTLQGDGERPGGTLNPETIAEFLAYDIPFRTPPAEGFVFPPGSR